MSQPRLTRLTRYSQYEIVIKKYIYFQKKDLAKNPKLNKQHRVRKC